MKVEFDNEEVWTMLDSIVDQVLALPEVKRSRSDAAALRRWRTSEMSPGSDGMKALAAKINAALQREHERAEVSPIKKPDWL